ncbi:MAG: hypothetical protein K2W95_29580 [Candidatus Obscuribacterales bacterium]|nr:hypothetical protein [Candidatus Obscuribacterales bacterium]
MTNEIDITRERQRRHLAAWRERAAIASRDGHQAFADAAAALSAKYSQLVELDVPEAEPAMFAAANLLRRKIEASEQHRTMSVEHGLNDEAIDVTIEIQEMEKELVTLVQTWQQERS